MIFVATLPPTSIVSGIAVLLIGRLLVLRRRKARSPAIRPNEGNE